MNGHHSKRGAYSKPNLRLITSVPAAQKEQGIAIVSAKDKTSGKAENTSSAVVIKFARETNAERDAKHSGAVFEKFAKVGAASSVWKGVETFIGNMFQLPGRIWAFVRRYHGKRRQLLASRELAMLDDHVLKDIGLNRYDIWVRAGSRQEHADD